VKSVEAVRQFVEDSVETIPCFCHEALECVAVIRIATAFSQNESLELAKERLRKFTEVLHPELRAILPD